MVGAALTAFLPMVGALLLGAGATLIVARRSWIPAIAALVLVIAPLAAVEISLGARVAVTAGAVFALVVLVERGLTWSSVIALVVLTGALLFGVDALTAQLAGTNLPALMTASFEDSLARVQDLPNAAEATPIIRGLMDWFIRLLPSFYVFEGLAIVIAGIAGSLFVARERALAYMRGFLRLDAPMVFVLALVIGILLIALSFLDTAASDLLATIGGNLVVMLRFVFAAQGFAVIMAMLVRSRMPMIVRVLALFIAVQVEIFTMGVSLVGLVDIWVNIRKLPRSDAGTPEASDSDRA